MIVDVHSHAWDPKKHFHGEFKEQMAQHGKSGGDVDLGVMLDEYRASSSEEVKTIVFGGKARLSGLWVDDEYVRDYVSQDSKNLVGFLSIDPTVSGWWDDIKVGHQDFGLKGIKIMPMYAGFSPNDEKFDELWEYASDNKLPVLSHTGTTGLSNAPLRHTLPRLFDDVAIRFPDVKIVMAHLGHPYEEECAVVIRKHKNVYADISGVYRINDLGYSLYNGLMAVQKWGVWDKVLFGSDYPFFGVDESIRGLSSLNHLVEGINLPKLNNGEIEKMVFRDSLDILGLF